MFARLTQQVKWQQPIIWALLAAFLLHLLLLLLATSSKEVSLEQRYFQATQVLLYDLQAPPLEPPLEAELPESELPESEQQAPEQIKPLPVQQTNESPPEPPVQQEAPAETPVEKNANLPLKTRASTPRLSGSLIARSLEIARLEAELAAMQTSYAQQPRVRRISSGAKMSSEEALYLRQWEERVERIGNLNYPEAARSQNLGGRLRLMVVIAADGRILEAQLLTGSGHSLLDDAALRILNLAAPFAPLPESIRAKADVLEIIRTWQFGDGWHAN